MDPQIYYCRRGEVISMTIDEGEVKMVPIACMASNTKEAETQTHDVIVIEVRRA